MSDIDPARHLAGPSGARVVSALTADIPLEAVPQSQSVSGAPATGSISLADPDGWDIGIWTHTAGVSTDTEADEIFVVLAGSATIEIDGGPTLQVGPGDVGFLPPGARTTWTVHEPLRKVYIIRG